MEKWISGLEQRLPQWLAKTQTQRVQWVYLIWQLLRSNPVILLLLSYVPFMLSQYCRKKTVVVLGEVREYYMDHAEMMTYFWDGPFKSKKLEQIDFHREGGQQSGSLWYTVKYNDNYYITHMNTVGDLGKCTKLFGEDIIFVERLLEVSGSIGVGKQLSESDAYEKILSKRYKCSAGAKFVAPTSINYVDFSSTFWVAMSILPILLQANNYEKLSNLLSLMIILLDLNRGQLYRLYDRLFNGIAKFVKLNVFKERTSLYDFFFIFSERWGYTDSAKKYAYVAKPGDRLKISYYCKLEKPDDIKIVGWERYKTCPKDQNIFMEIAIDEAHCKLMQYDGLYAVVELGRHVYVP